MTARSELSLPPHTETLGYGGLIPFATLVAALWAVAPELQVVLVRALLAYGAAILAFLGAVHWGYALARPSEHSTRVLAVGVLPSLVAAVSLMLAPAAALGTQILAFGALWLYEHRVLGAEFFGDRYLELRRNLTGCVVLLLVLALLGPVARLAGGG